MHYSMGLVSAVVKKNSDVILLFNLKPIISEYLVVKIYIVIIQSLRKKLNKLSH